jgi:hypothetical protein
MVAARVSQAALAANRPEGRCARGPVDEVGEQLLDDGVTVVGQVRGHGGQVGVGQEGVVAPEREQFVLAFWCGVEFPDPA